MSGSLNKVMLIGNLGDDVKMVNFDDGGCLGRFPIATNESYNNKQTGEKVVNTEWHNIVVKNKAAEICAKYLKKGDKVYVEGKLKTRKMKATLSLKKTKPIMVMINGDLVSPAPLKAPPKANSIAISGCIEPRNQTKITVSLITSGSLIKNPDISSEKIATVFTTATTQVERGSYPYTRVTIETDASTSPAEVKITAHGIKQDALSNLLNAGSSIDWRFIYETATEQANFGAITAETLSTIDFGSIVTA